MSAYLSMGTASIAQEADASLSVDTYLIATLFCAKWWPICLSIAHSDIGPTARRVAEHHSWPGYVTFLH